MDDDTGPITHDEAREIARRYNASHWRNAESERARYTIPADPRRDDDIRLDAYITQRESAERAAYERGRSEERERCAALVESIGEQTGGIAGAVVRGLALAIRHMPEEESDT